MLPIVGALESDVDNAALFLTFDESWGCFGQEDGNCAFE